MEFETIQVSIIRVHVKCIKSMNM